MRHSTKLAGTHDFILEFATIVRHDDRGVRREPVRRRLGRRGSSDVRPSLAILLLGLLVGITAQSGCSGRETLSKQEAEAILIACALLQTAHAADAAKPQVTLSWLESCAGEQQPYFQIEVFANKYRYRGSPGMREQAEVVRKLPRDQAKRLAGDVKAYAADAAKRFAALPDKREQPLTYCIKLQWDGETFAFGDVSVLVGGVTHAQVNGELSSFEELLGPDDRFQEAGMPGARVRSGLHGLLRNTGDLFRDHRR